MKKLWALIAIGTLCTQTWAADLSALISHNIAKQSTSLAVGPLDKLLQAAACLYQGRKACQVISWDNAERLIKQTQQKAGQRQALLQQYQNLHNSLALSQGTQAPYQLEQEKTIFQQAAKTKFIFIGESHLPGVAPAVVRALRTIRQIKPNARILLASEFAVTFAPFQAVPFQKAGTQNRYFKDPQLSYQAVFQAAEQLKMDVLSLDDAWIEAPVNGRKEWGFSAKVGNYLVNANYATAQIQDLGRIAGGIQKVDPLQIVGMVHDYFSASPWGWEQRNLQWAKYIAAMQANYDVIIIYGGSSHFEPTTGIVAVPQLLKLTTYTYIELDKVPTPQEQAQIDQVSRQRNPQAGKAQLAPRAKIAYRTPFAGNVQAKPGQEAAFAQLRNLEKQLGFEGINPYIVQIILPQ